MSEAAAEFHEMGYDLVPQRGAHAQYCDYLVGKRTYEREHGRSVRAELQTRCGCVRQMFVAYPPPRMVRIPMSGDSRIWSDAVPDVAAVPVVVRDFELHEETVVGGIPCYRYREIP